MNDTCSARKREREREGGGRHTKQVGAGDRGKLARGRHSRDEVERVVEADSIDALHSSAAFVTRRAMGTRNGVGSARCESDKCRGAVLRRLRPC